MIKRYSLTRVCRLLVIVMFYAFRAMTAAAQSPESRITQPIVNFQRVTLPGHVHSLARAEYDQGAVEDSAPANRIVLLLSRTETQQKALDRLLEEQQTQGSANYHRWLTPEEFGAQFGASESDVQKITAWLTGKGFTVEKVAANKVLIEFSGTAGQVRNAFATELHNYALPGGTFMANNLDPQIPVAFASVVSGFASLNSFPRRSFTHVLGTVVHSSTGTIQPQWTTNGGSYAIGPGDFATIYNSFPLLKNSIDGSSQTIGVVGRSQISTSDIANLYIHSHLLSHGIRCNDNPNQHIHGD